MRRSGTSSIVARAPVQRERKVKRVPRVVRRASSADLREPLESLHLPSGQRRQKAQQRPHPLGRAARKALEERSRQRAFIDRRHESGARDPPEGRRREEKAPPPPPALDRVAVDADKLLEPAQP